RPAGRLDDSDGRRAHLPETQPGATQNLAEGRGDREVAVHAARLRMGDQGRGEEQRDVGLTRELIQRRAERFRRNVEVSRALGGAGLRSRAPEDQSASKRTAAGQPRKTELRVPMTGR